MCLNYALSGHEAATKHDQTHAHASLRPNYASGPARPRSATGEFTQYEAPSGQAKQRIRTDPPRTIKPQVVTDMSSQPGALTDYVPPR